MKFERSSTTSIIKTVGTFGLNVRIIKSVKNLILMPLTKLVNMCIRNWVFPEVLKRALVVCEVFKKGFTEIMLW